MIQRVKIVIPSILLGVILLISSCSSSNNIRAYENNSPLLDLKEFFTGSLTASGVVKNRSGKVIRYFNADLVGSWVGNTGTLKEIFYFNDGKTEYRDWTLQLDEDSPGVFSGSANDVIGISTGTYSGNAIFMEYILQIPYKSGTTNIKVDDRMFLVSKDTIINESAFYKYGIKVGEAVLTIQRK